MKQMELKRVKDEDLVLVRVFMGKGITADGVDGRTTYQV